MGMTTEVQRRGTMHLSYIFISLFPSSYLWIYIWRYIILRLKNILNVAMEIQEKSTNSTRYFKFILMPIRNLIRWCWKYKSTPKFYRFLLTDATRLINRSVLIGSIILHTCHLQLNRERALNYWVKFWLSWWVMA